MEHLCAESDEEAMIEAWSLYRRHPDAHCGLELWQDNRLVFRHVPAAAIPLKRSGAPGRQ